MNKNIVFIVIAVLVGVLIGWLVFGTASKAETQHNHEQVSESKTMWTCSMHPQIMQPEAGDCPICGMDLIPAESGSDGLLADQFKLTENAMALANIRTSIVGKNNPEENSTQLSGKIAENEEANSVQASYFSGRIERLNVNTTGEEIRKGQLLATIYSPELYAAQQELITASSLKESQPELYKAVRNKLKIWKLSENQINQIEASGKVKENFPIFASLSGTVSEKLVNQGDYVKQGQPLLKIANLNTVWANFDVYENQIDLFKKGQEVKVTTNVNKEITGKVAFINPTLNTQTRTLTLRVVLNNKEGNLKPGMFVKANIKRGSIANKIMITVPSSAVLWTGERSLVYIKTDPNTPIFEMRKVTLGNQTGENYEVLEGLNSGDEIVTNGTFTVDAAAQLNGKKSMMNAQSDNSIEDHKGHSEMENSNSENNKSFNINERVVVSKEFQNQLKEVFNGYINLKDALVEEDSQRISKASKEVVANLAKVDMKLLKNEDVHLHWMSLEKEMEISVKSVLNASKIDEQRVYFKSLSFNLTNAVEVFGINEKVYHQFCPMANSNNGAYWLSKEEKVINPYFGDAMLTCGEVKQIIE